MGAPAEFPSATISRRLRATSTGGSRWGLNFALWTYNGMAAYVAKYVLGNSNLIAVIGLATVIPMVIGLPFAGPLVARFGKRNASMAGLVLVAVGSLLVFVDPSNLWVFFVSIIVRMVGIIPMNAALNAMSGDVVEYGEWRSGVRSDGIVFSSSSFSMKVAMGVSSAAIAWILGASGYDGSLAVRSDATVSAMVNTFVWVPVAMVVVMAALLFFYDLDKRVDRVGGELAARRVSRKGHWDCRGVRACIQWVRARTCWRRVVKTCLED